MALEVDGWARREEEVLLLDAKAEGRTLKVVVFILLAVAMKIDIMIGRSMVMLENRRATICR